MRSSSLTALVVLLVVSVAAPARAQNVSAHRGAAERALVKERWCEAVFLYTKLDAVDQNAEHALHAADAAQFADDRDKALALYKDALARAPKHPRARQMQQSIDALTKLIAKSGAGTACSVPRAECGNGLVESGESCDDGNRADGDTCPAACSGAAAAPAPAPVKGATAAPAAPAPPKGAAAAPPPAAAAQPPAAPAKGAAAPPAPTPAASSAEAASLNEPCTLIKPVKVFAKGAWKTLAFGTTFTIRSRGPQWTMVDLTGGGQGKIATPALEGACEAPPAVTGVMADVDDDDDDEDDDSGGGNRLVGRLAPDAPKSDPKATPAAAASAPTDAPAADETGPEPAVTGGGASDGDVGDDAAAAKPMKPLAPLEREDGPASRAPDVDKAKGGLGGWIMVGVGAALTLAGGGAALAGAAPYFDYARLCETGPFQTDCPALVELGDDHASESDADDRAEIAAEAEDLRTDVDNAAQAWDEGKSTGLLPTGRFVMATGLGAAGVGVGLMVGGLVWALVGGAPADDDGELE